MEGRFGLLVVCMILLGAAVAGQYFWRLNDKTQELAELRVLLSQAKRTLETKETLTRSRGRALDSDKELVDKYKSMAETQAQLTDEVVILDAELAALEKEFAESVSKVRAAAGDLPPEDVLLNNGQVLSAAKVQRMTDQDVTFQHAGGISKVEAKDLPREVRDRYRQLLSPFAPEGSMKDPATPAAPPPRGAKKK